MSWVLAFVGFAALIVLHEFGHFVAAKAVGMRVERFALFFPPLIWKVKRGETEYGIGSIPLGGYVRITGMNPNEEIPPELEHRAYYRQAVWKRVVVILAGPLMNVIIAFVILFGVFAITGPPEVTQTVGKVDPALPAARALQPGDEIVAVDGRGGGIEAIGNQIRAHRCAGTPKAGCRASEPASVVIERDGRRRTVTLTPVYDEVTKRMRLGIQWRSVNNPGSLTQSADFAVTAMWNVTTATFDALARIFDPEKRKEISGVIGSYETTRQSFSFNTTQAFVVLAVISLSLAIVNLFPFLPLDGGHVFWALAEKIRGRAIPFSTLERASVVGFFLVIMIFAIGFTNDIGRLRGEGFNVR